MVNMNNHELANVNGGGVFATIAKAVSDFVDSKVKAVNSAIKKGEEKSLAADKKK